MKVWQLIEALKQFPPDREIFVDGSDMDFEMLHNGAIRSIEVFRLDYDPGYSGLYEEVFKWDDGQILRPSDGSPVISGVLLSRERVV
jgi:hypothetical protein